MEEGEGVEPSGVTPAWFSRPVAHRWAPPSVVGRPDSYRRPLRPERSALGAVPSRGVEPLTFAVSERRPYHLGHDGEGIRTHRRLSRASVGRPRASCIGFEPTISA